MTQWYYSDADRNRHGPLEADTMIDLHRRGELGAETLVWRDGLTQWRPWRELAGELIASPGFAAAAAPAPATADPVAAAVSARLDAAEHAAQASPQAAPAAADRDSPYAAPRAGVDEIAEVVHGHEVVHVGFWKRMAAYLIDSMLIGIAYYAVSMFMTVFVLAIGMASASWMSKPEVAMALMIGGVYLLMGALSLAYYVGFESSSMQATLGKRAVGIKTVDLDGRRLTRGRAFGRWLASWLSYATLGVGYLMIAFTDRKRGLHDLVAKTQVVDRWAYTAQPDLQRRDLGPVAIVVLVLGGLMWLLTIGLVAALALLPTLMR
ncbi:RDD family protein [Lysobacter firmicutimachus]|uniref:RDD family protein n=1 Tax=Lysobacter firmicutimachus TaxID=1792846 RepID=A0AAU8MZX1_9GAMM